MRSEESESIHIPPEAKYYVQTERGIHCLLCPHECLLSEGETGICRSRQVYDGKLRSHSYQHPCAVHVDPIEKKPFYHFSPGSRTLSIGTAGCNLSCKNCQNASISQRSPLQIKSSLVTPGQIIGMADYEDCTSIAYTYTEPTIFYEYMFETSILASQAGLSNLMVTNGYISEKPLRDILPYLSAVNIDLKSFDSDTFRRLTGGKLRHVLRTLEILKESDVWIEITYLIIPDWTDSERDIEQMCQWLNDRGFSDTPLHFSRFHPSFQLMELPPTPLNSLVRASEIAMKAGLKHVYLGNVPWGAGENTSCSNCHTELITRSGFQVLVNRLEQGRCPVCQKPVSGRW